MAAVRVVLQTTKDRAEEATRRSSARHSNGAFCGRNLIMKSIAHVVFATALAVSAQAARSDEAAEGGVRMESSEPYVNVAAVGTWAERRDDVLVAPSARRESLPEKLGLVGRDGFPSRGGPIDD
jgi:hypothetical protein